MKTDSNDGLCVPGEIEWVSDPLRIVKWVRSRFRDADYVLGQIAGIAAEVRQHVVGDKEDDDERELVALLGAVDEACDQVAAVHRRVKRPPETTAPAAADAEIDRLLAVIADAVPLARHLGEVASQLHLRLAAMTDYDDIEVGKEDKYEIQGRDGTWIVLDGRTLVAVREELTADVYEAACVALQLARRMGGDDGAAGTLTPMSTPAAAADAQSA